MDKLEWLDDRILLFFCPACKCAHYARVAGDGPLHAWNGDMNAPTFSPDIIFSKGEKESRCAATITDGKIVYAKTCFHEFKDRTLYLPEWFAAMAKYPAMTTAT